jgi:hypothetical protein
MGRRPNALKGTRALYASPQPHVVVGIAHVVTGALRVLNFMVFTLATGGAAVLSAYSATMIVVAGVTVLGGLWLADGRRRGALLTFAMDAVHVVMLFVVSPGSSTLDLIVNAALAVAVIWVLPRMTVEREAEARNARVAAERATDQT